MKHCLICFEDVYTKTSLLQYFQKEDSICGKCASHFVRCSETLHLPNMPLEACYLYNDFLESLFFQFKEGRDVALKEVFLRNEVQRIEKKYRDFTIVYMPSSKQKQKERNFFALQLLFERVHLPKVVLFEKKSDVKQSMQSWENRKNIKNQIQLIKGIAIVQSKLLLVDDVCTSGSTLNSARALLVDHPYEICALVISVHSHFLETME